MITTRGKGLIARALANQIPSAFSYISLGVGALPQVPVTVVEQLTAEWAADTTVYDSGVWLLDTDTGLAKLSDGVNDWADLDYQATGVLYEEESIKNKTVMDFEALRIPVSGASVLFEGGQTKVVLTGQLPSAQRYEFSEIGVFSAESNSLLNTEAPRMIYTFSDVEGWEYHTGSTITDVAYTSNISTNNFDIDAPPTDAFFVSADNPVFFAADRANQRMRIYQDALLVHGDMSTVDDTLDTWALSGDHVHITGNLVDLTRARSDDEVKIAFSVMNKNYSYITTDGVANEVRIAIRFMSSEESSAHATAQIRLTDGATEDFQYPAETDLVNNGYYVKSFRKKDLVYTESFSWENVTVCQVWVEVDPGTAQTSADYFVAVDAIRFDSNNDNNPAYGLAAYSQIRNAAGSTEVKVAQSESQIEYKVYLEVV